MSVVDVRMPPSSTGGPVRLARWCVPDGGVVERADPVCEVETGKAYAEVPAPAAGTLTRVAAAGDDLEAGQLLARIISR